MNMQFRTESSSHWRFSGKTAFFVQKLAQSAMVIALFMSLMFTGQTALAANITITTINDELNADGDCSLREAIESANTDTAIDACLAGAGTDTIILPAGTYVLSI